jgi:hypothetical protein
MSAFQYFRRPFVSITEDQRIRIDQKAHANLIDVTGLPSAEI